MASIFPFQGLRYTPGRVDLQKVVTQPYDKISPQMQAKYYDADPHNIVRIVLGRADPADSSSNNVYTRAAQYLNEWLRIGILSPLPGPCFLACVQRFLIPGTQEERVRTGFIGLGQIEDYSRRIVFPHERTLSGPKQDRLNLLRHTRTHFEQIFMLYEDEERTIDAALDKARQGKPDMDVTDEYGVTHQLWIVQQQNTLELIRNQMSSKKLIIADGHHRYETSLAYRDEMRSAQGPLPGAPWERMPMAFFNLHSPGLTILPTHRVLAGVTDFDGETLLRRAAEFFDIQDAEPEPAQFRKQLQEAGKTRITLGAYLDTGRRNLLLSLRNSGAWRLDVEVLHRLVIEKCMGIGEEAVQKESHISYVREFDAALEAVRSGKAQISFLLNPTRLDQMRDIALAGGVMPQKSTDFHPKVLSGLVLYHV
jgi:uncharacterized protein (DUF1015 family)